MKTQMPLTEFAAIRGKQKLLATAIGITTGAMTQMVQSGRDITVFISDDGTLEAYETKRLGKAS